MEICIRTYRKSVLLEINVSDSRGISLCLNPGAPGRILRTVSRRKRNQFKSVTDPYDTRRTRGLSDTGYENFTENSPGSQTRDVGSSLSSGLHYLICSQIERFSKRWSLNESFCSVENSQMISTLYSRMNSVIINNEIARFQQDDSINWHHDRSYLNAYTLNEARSSVNTWTPCSLHVVRILLFDDSESS